MFFSSRHLHAANLAIFVTSTLLQQSALANMCPDHYSGRLAVDNCEGYVDCMNGVEIDTASCEVGTLYSSSTENCEAAELVSCVGTDVPSSTTTDTPAIADDGGMWIEDARTPSSIIPIAYDGPDSVAVSATAAVNVKTDSPVLVDDKDTWVPDETVTTSTEKIAYDGPDAVAPWSTPAPPVDIQTTVPAVVSDGPDATAIWSTTEANDRRSTPSAIDQYYTPNRSENRCNPVDRITENGRNSKRLLRSVWDAWYPTKDDCCVVFLFNQKHYDSCINN